MGFPFLSNIGLINLLSLLKRIFSIQSSKLQSILSVDRHSLGRDILDFVFLADSRSLWRDFLNYDSPFADPNGWYGSESDPSGFPSGISLQIAEIERQSAIYTNAVTMKIFIHKSTNFIIIQSLRCFPLMWCLKFTRVLKKTQSLKCSLRSN